jgi:formamidopyrimidine-DNA glycosylase
MPELPEVAPCSGRSSSVARAGSVHVMPELPEVESVRRQLAPELTGRRIEAVWWDPHPQQRFSDVDLAVGCRVLEVSRRGKFLLVPLVSPAADEELELILHLGMTGSFRFAPADAARTPEQDAAEHVRARFTLDDGRELRFRDPRRFGRVSVVPAGEYAGRVPTLATLGPEPLSDAFDAARFAHGLARTQAPVKAALLGQRLVAGVGNIYADEALWRARIYPASRRVGRARALVLRDAIRDVLTEAIEREGTTFRDYQMINGESGRNADFLDAYGQGDRPCSRCGTPLRRTVIAQRGTTYCPRCQRH